MSNKPSFGLIKEVVTEPPSTVTNTKYIVVFVYENQEWEIGPLEPSNRRPTNSSIVQIVPAQPGDICGLYWNSSNEVAAFIIEGLVTAECEQGLQRTNFRGMTFDTPRTAIADFALRNQTAAPPSRFRRPSIQSNLPTPNTPEANIDMTGRELGNINFNQGSI